jgi:hypothetical protein
MHWIFSPGDININPDVGNRACLQYGFLLSIDILYIAWEIINVGSNDIYWAEFILHPLIQYANDLS